VTQGKASLRSLARQYAAGELSRDEYSRQRRAIIEAVVAGELQAPAPVGDTLVEAEAAAPAPASPPQAAARGGRRPLVIGAVAAAAVLLAGAYWTISGDGEQASPATPSPERSASEAPASAPAPGSGAASWPALEGFLASGQWQEAELAELTEAWQALPPAKRIDIRGSADFRALVSELHGELVRLQGLAELGGGDAVRRRAERLLAFAAALGIEDAAVTAARRAFEAQASDEPASPPAAAPDPAPQPGAKPEPASELQPASEPEPEPASEPEPESESEAAPSASADPRAATPAAGPASPPARAHNPEACRAALAGSRRPYCRDPLPGGGSAPVMAVVPAGSFTMGGRRSGETPRTEVRFDQPFAISVYEVAVGDYLRFCRATQRPCPPQPQAAMDLPVVNVSWHDAVAYTEWLSAQTGRRYRLPSEAEWEYATRAGSTSPYPFGDTVLPTHAQFAYQSVPEAPKPRSDRSVNKNRFNLYHTIGNVREWVLDAWHPDLEGMPAGGSARPGDTGLRAVRGGSYRDAADGVRSASRAPLSAGAADELTGFRVVQEIRRAPEDPAAANADLRWLQQQDNEAFTLQLVAVRNPQGIEALRAEHPGIALRVLPVAGAEPLYRVVHGSFASSEAALQAHAALPAGLTSLAARPIVKRFGELKTQTLGAD